MNTRTARISYTQVGARWRATAQSGLGPVTADGESRDAARTALERMLTIARAIEVTRRRAAT